MKKECKIISCKGKPSSNSYDNFIDAIIAKMRAEMNVLGDLLDNKMTEEERIKIVKEMEELHKMIKYAHKVTENQSKV